MPPSSGGETGGFFRHFKSDNQGNGSFSLSVRNVTQHTRVTAAFVVLRESEEDKSRKAAGAQLSKRRTAAESRVFRG